MDTSLYYQEKGKVIPFILLHGNGERGEMNVGKQYKVQTKDLCKQAKLANIDYRSNR